MPDPKIEILSRYMPGQAAMLVTQWINEYQCEFKISRSRNSKFGDYRAPYQEKGHRISVNYNLNPYAFLITTVHEFAHLVTWNKYRHKVKPHGQEWKQQFKVMMVPFFNMDIFPQDVKKAVVDYLKNPAASSCSDKQLFQTLRSYDEQKTDGLSVEQLEENQVFATSNGRVFKRLNKVRTRYRCLEIKTGLHYLFNPLAEVKLVS